MATIKIPDDQAATTKTPDVKAATTKTPDDKATTTKTSDEKVATTKTPDVKAATTKTPGVKAATPKANDDKAATTKTPDDKATTTKTPDVKAATPKTPHEKVATTKTSDDQAARTKTSDDQAATTKTPDDKTATTHIPDAKAADATASTNITMTDTDCEVTFVGSTADGAPKNSRFLLAKQDIKIVTSGEWLTDHIIGAAQSVLQSQFPYANGLENTTLGPLYNFSEQKGEFAQILQTGSHHWILVSNIGSSNQSEVKLYDSLFRGWIPIFVKKQIASLLHEESRSFKIIVPRVQRQNNYDDCGVFAAVFLVYLLHGLNPADLTFDSAEVRRHLLDSLKKGFFYPFPLSKVQERRNREPRLVQEVPVICECRMPWDNSDRKFPSL